MSMATAPTDELESAWAKARTENNPVPHDLPPGIHLNIAFDDYCRIPAVNFSSLKTAKTSLAHYRYAEPPEDSPTFRLGSFIHCGKLEPDELDKRYVVLPDGDFVEQIQRDRKLAGEEPYASPRATKVYKELVRNYLLAHPGKQEVTTAWYEDMRGILRSLAMDPECSTLFKQGLSEVTLVARDPFTGLLLKARTDFLSTSHLSCLADLKTAQDPFSWSPDKFDYHVQAAHYLYTYRLAYEATPPDLRPSLSPSLARFWFIVLEKTRPWTVLPAPLDDQALTVGFTEHAYLIRRISEAIENQRYPRIKHIRSWSLSHWYKPMEFPLAQADERLGSSAVTPRPAPALATEHPVATEQTATPAKPKKSPAKGRKPNRKKTKQRH